MCCSRRPTFYVETFYDFMVVDIVTNKMFNDKFIRIYYWLIYNHFEMYYVLITDFLGGVRFHKKKKKHHIYKNNFD